MQNIIIRQRGSKHNPGANVYISKDHTLHARVDGVVHFQKKEITNHTFQLFHLKLKHN
jgi:ribosomal protein L27